MFSQKLFYTTASVKPTCSSWIHRSIEGFRLQVSSGDHLIHTLAQRHVRFEHVIQDICSQFLYISMDGNSYNQGHLLGPLTLRITTCLWKTHLLQSHGIFFVEAWITSSPCTSDSGPLRVQPKNRELKTAIMFSFNQVSNLHYSMVSWPAWSFAYQGAHNCTQYFSLSIMRMKERGIIIFPGLWAVLLRPPKMFLLRELFGNVLKIFYPTNAIGIQILWIAEPMGMFAFTKLFSSRHFIYIRKI